MTLELINPDIIVTVGLKALEALKCIKDHDFVLRDCVAKKLSWNNRYIFPVYHMGPRATIHRGIIKQRSDFIVLSHIVDPIKGIKNDPIKKMRIRKTNINIDSRLLDMVVIIIKELKSVSLFKLTKLIYLIDYNHYNDFGNSISGSIYLRMQDGPWIPTLRNITKEYEEKLYKITFEKRKPILSYISNNHVSGLTDEQKHYIINIVKKYKDFTEAALKIATYRTKPMQYILEQEKMGRNMSRIPILYKNLSILETDKNN
jgi:uncharacterized phage-associated protein